MDDFVSFTSIAKYRKQVRWECLYYFILKNFSQVFTICNETFLIEQVHFGSTRTDPVTQNQSYLKDGTKKSSISWGAYSDDNIH